MRARCESRDRRARSIPVSQSDVAMTERLFILDTPGYVYRAYHALPYLSTSKGLPSHVMLGTSTMVWMPLLEVPGFEADDVLGTLVDRVRDSSVDVVLVTADKDMLQLVGPRVRVFTTSGRGGERVVLDEAAVKVKMGVSPEQIPDLLALMGDSIDNIPGVPGVGEKTAVKLIAQFGSVERLYENLPLVPGKLRETLATGRKDALLSRELAL